MSRPIPKLEVEYVNELPTLTVSGPDEDLAYTVKGTGSMLPYLMKGDRALAVPYRGGKVPSGTVLILKLPWATDPVIHEAIKDDGDNVLTAGYANDRPDGWQPKSSIIAVVQSIKRVKP